jgi:outer membrane protein OmpA-like peptidoglycan-associated protein
MAHPKGGEIMRRAQLTIGFALLSFLSAAAVVFTVHAQQGGQFTDFRERSDYTAEELGKALFPEATPEPRTRGIGPQRPQQAPPEGSAVALNVLFEFNSDKVLPDYYPDIDKLGKALTLPEYENYRVRIEGHTDNVGSDRYNQSLSQKRAESVKRYLVQHFQLEPERLSVTGYGKINPITTNDTPEGRSKNRRVQVVNLGKK